MKAFISEYGLIIVAAIVIMIIVVVAPIVGNKMADGSRTAVDKMTFAMDAESGSEEVVLEAGLHRADGTVTTWDTLVNENKISVSNNQLTYVDSSMSGHLVVPESITELNEYAFLDCYSLSATIHKGITNIAPFTLDSLKKVNFTGTKEEFLAATVEVFPDWYYSGEVHCENGVLTF